MAKTKTTKKKAAEKSNVLPFRTRKKSAPSAPPKTETFRDGFESDLVPLDSLRAHPKNYKIHPEEQIEHLKASLLQFGYYKNVVVARDGTILAGHGVWEAARGIEWKKIPVRRLDLDPNSPAALKIVAADNELPLIADRNELVLAELLKTVRDEDVTGLLGTGFDEKKLAALLTNALGTGGENPLGERPETKTLFERFGVPPFSVFDARQGYWQERKRAWIALGIRSEEGRAKEPPRSRAKEGKDSDGVLWKSQAVADPAFYTKKRAVEAKLGKELELDEYVRDYYVAPESGASSGTSVFDPVLCELAYRWFAPKGGKVLDPFAGGSVRGVVAGRLGLTYTGIDLSETQTKANAKQWKEIAKNYPAKGTVAPVWIAGDSRELAEKAELVDLVFSCPPYADLERYSDDPRDLSTLEYGEFREAYFEIIEKAVSRLRPNSFAIFVVGEVRSKDESGVYRGFVPDTIAAFERAGAKYYNEAILLTPLGSVPVRAARYFEAGRKLGKALRNGTPVLTPTGWTAIEELKEGDLVIAGDGTPTRVLGVFPQGERRLFTVRFNDGSSVDADAEHLWAIESRGTERRVLTTAQIVETFGDEPEDPRPMIPFCGAVQMEAWPVPVDPYLVGLLLGDGGLTGNTPILSTADVETIERLPSLLPPGMEIKSRGIDHRLVGEGSRSSKNPLTLSLRTLGMMGKYAHEKTVPSIYLWNEVSVRTAVLRGLMDSDGSVTRGSSGCTEFQSSSKELADGVVFLARSLGARASCVEGTTPSGRARYRVRIRGGECPFLLSRKADIWKDADAKRTRRKERRIESIVETTPGEATCISVEHPDSLYVTKDFIVTHNTHQNVLVFLKGDAEKAVKKLGATEFGALEDSFGDKLELPDAPSPAAEA